MRLISRSLFLLCSAAWLLAQTPVPRVSQTYRHYCFDFNWVDKLDRAGRPLSNYSNLRAENHIRDLAEMHANSLMVFTMSISGYTFYDSKVAERHPTLKYDYLKEMIRLGHARGIAMELYVPTFWADRLVQRNPSWGVRRPDGSLETSLYGGYHPDPNSPAADWYVSMLKELIPAYGAEAFFADGINFPRYGQSEYTVSKFREAMGRAYPKSLAEDPDWRATLRWEIAQVEKFWRLVRDTVKQQDPRVEVTFNGPGPDLRAPYNGWAPTPPHLNQLADYAFTEAGSSGEFATWTRGISWPKPFKVSFLNPYSILDPFIPDEIRARVGRTLAAGGQPYRYDRTSINGEANRHFTETWSAIFKEVQAKETYVLGAEPVKYVAVVSSEPTMLFRGRADDSSHSKDMVGALRTLDALHIQHDVVADWNLKPEFLAAYQLVILPNVACMTDAQAAAVREYVRRGGSILATAETSLFDENGKPHADFALADVLGIHVDEPVTGDLQAGDRKKPIYILPPSGSHAILASLPKTELILPGDSVYARAAAGAPTAALILDAGTPAPSPGQPTARVAVQVNAFGKGKAVYVCGSLFARTHHQRNAGIFWPDEFLGKAIDFLAPNPPWRVKASTRVWAGLSHQRAERRHLLHLVNWQTDLPATVEFSLPSNTDAGSRAAVVWPARRALLAKEKDGRRVYTLPNVGPHVIVTLER